MEHYFSPQPSVPSRPGSVTLDVGGRLLRLATDAGVFSPEHVDPGTRLLLRRGPAPPEGGDLLDAGCGYGPIAIALALRASAARVWAVDVNERALELARANAASAGCENIVVARPDQVPPRLRFAGIWSNPPIRIGLAALHPLLTGWLDRLAVGAEATLVVHRHLGADSLQAWLRRQGYAAERRASHAGYRLLAVRPRPSSDENA